MEQNTDLQLEKDFLCLDGYRLGINKPFKNIFLLYIFVPFLLQATNDIDFVKSWLAKVEDDDEYCMEECRQLSRIVSLHIMCNTNMDMLTNASQWTDVTVIYTCISIMLYITNCKDSLLGYTKMEKINVCCALLQELFCFVLLSQSIIIYTLDSLICFLIAKNLYINNKKFFVQFSVFLKQKIERYTFNFH